MMPALYMVMFLELLVTASGLRCLKCLPWQGNCKGEVETCAPRQKACAVNKLGLSPVMIDALRVGCGTCNPLPSDTAAGLSISSFCCYGDLCKAVNMGNLGPAWRLPCQTCVGSATECGPDTPTLTCADPQAQCLQISRRLLPGERGDSMYKACGWPGPPKELLAITAGSDLTYVHLQRCHGTSCNNGSFTEMPQEKHNGRLCYSCRERGAGECNRLQMPVMSCTGAMDQCVKVQSTDKNNPRTLLRGCGTSNLCHAWHPLTRLLLPWDQKLHCCSENLCNRAAPRRDPLPTLLLPLALLLLLVGLWS